MALAVPVAARPPFSNKPLYNFIIDYPIAFKAIGAVGLFFASLALKTGKPLLLRVTAAAVGAVICSALAHLPSIKKYTESRAFHIASSALDEAREPAPTTVQLNSSRAKIENELLRAGPHEAALRDMLEEVEDLLLARAHPVRPPILEFLRPGMSLPNLQAALAHNIVPRTLPAGGIFPPQVPAHHEVAKAALVEALARTNPLESVSFHRANTLIPTDEALAALQADAATPLDPAIFHWSRTDGVQRDIPQAARNAARIHLFQLASQNNAGEAPRIFTPPPGRAMAASAGDNTQGPLAQRTNPALFEKVNAFLANCGFNMLANVLSRRNITAVQHGYLVPQTAAQMDSIVGEFRANWRNVEQPCVLSQLPTGGRAYLMMSAAPAIGYAPEAGRQGTDPNSNPLLQYYSALANFCGQFSRVLELARENPGTQVVYNACAVGLGVFGNQPENVAPAFRHAALAFQEAVRAEGLNVVVQFEVFRGEGLAKNMADRLNLAQRPRVE